MTLYIPKSFMFRAGDVAVVKDDLTGHVTRYTVGTVDPDKKPVLVDHGTRHGCPETLVEILPCTDMEHEAFLKRTLDTRWATRWTTGNRNTLADILSARGEHPEALNTAFPKVAPWEMIRHDARKGRIPYQGDEGLEFVSGQTNIHVVHESRRRRYTTGRIPYGSGICRGPHSFTACWSGASPDLEFSGETPVDALRRLRTWVRNMADVADRLDGTET